MQRANTQWPCLLLSIEIWNPFKVGDIQALEILQQLFLSWMRGMQNPSYLEQLKQLKMYSLERRWESDRARYPCMYVESLKRMHTIATYHHSVSSKMRRNMQSTQCFSRCPWGSKNLPFFPQGIKELHMWDCWRVQVPIGSLPPSRTSWDSHSWLHII